MDLEFGTAGFRGIIGAGINRMNIYVVSNGNPLVSSALLDNIVSKPLCSPAYYINIHTVNTCTDNSP